MTMATSRRGFLGGLIAAMAAPAIVHAGNLMPISAKLLLPDDEHYFCVVHPQILKDIQAEINALRSKALFAQGDLLYNGVIIRPLREDKCGRIFCGRTRILSSERASWK